jgi:hypothetical protein
MGAILIIVGAILINVGAILQWGVLTCIPSKNEEINLIIKSRYVQ